MINSPVYNAQVASFSVAKALAGTSANISTMDAITAQKPPYCLRIVKEYRLESTQLFRNLVAQRIRANRIEARQ